MLANASCLCQTAACLHTRPPSLRRQFVNAILVATLGAAAFPALCAAQSGTPPLPRDGRWQLRLASGVYLFDVRPVHAAGDSLVVARLDTLPAATQAVAIADIAELRLVQPSTLQFQTGAESPFGELVGAGDVIFSLTGVNAAERRRIVDEVLRAAVAAPPRER